MESLINRDNQQPALPAGSGETLDTILARCEAARAAGEAPAKEYTAQWLFDHARWRYDAIVILTAERWGVHRIGALLHVGTHTIETVRDREGEKVATLRDRIARTARRGALLVSEEIHRRMADPDKAAEVGNEVLAKWLNDLIHAAELLSGGVTERTERVTSTAGEHDTFARYLESLEQADAVALPPATGSGVEKNAAEGTGDDTAGASGSPDAPTPVCQDRPGERPDGPEYDDVKQDV